MTTNAHVASKQMQMLLATAVLSLAATAQSQSVNQTIHPLLKQHVSTGGGIPRVANTDPFFLQRGAVCIDGTPAGSVQPFHHSFQHVHTHTVPRRT